MCYSSITLEGLDMANATTIEWTDATWNPVTGCTKISKAATIVTRRGSPNGFAGHPATHLKLASI